MDQCTISTPEQPAMALEMAEAIDASDQLLARGCHQVQHGLAH